MQARKISSFLWFQAQAAEAVTFYATVFGDDCSACSTTRTRKRPSAC